MSYILKGDVAMSELIVLAENGRFVECNMSGEHGVSYKKSNFKYAYIIKCNFINCKFWMSEWREAVIDRCDMKNTEFSSCIFVDTYFKEVDFRDSAFINCSFVCCRFDGCNFEKAKLGANAWYGSYFENCNFKGVILPQPFDPNTFRNNRNVPYIPMVCPDEGEFIGYKVGLTCNYKRVLITLKVPADARRSSAGGRKCRCDKATVIDLEWIDPVLRTMEKPPTSARSLITFYGTVVYKIGEEVTPQAREFDPDRWQECSSGIHFFMNKKEALKFARSRV